MKIETAKNRIELIQKKINEEDRKVWEPCRKAYEGDREGLPEDLHDVNLIWGTIRTLIPELFFNLPRFKLKAKSARMTEDMRAKEEALLNAIIAEKKMSFSHVMKLTILAAHLNLGVVTWGCNSEFIDNPLAGQPMLDTETGEILMDVSGEPILQPQKIAIKDSYYVKRIRAQDFYPDLFSGEVFSQLRYYAIAEFMSKSDIRRAWPKAPVSKLEGSVSYFELDERLRKRIQDEEEYSGPKELKDEYLRFRVYRMYDRERGKVYTFCNEYDKFLDVSDMPRTEPVAVLKFNDKLDEFWPIHEITQTKSLQHEIEFTSTMLSEHVSRSAKKVGYTPEALDDAALSKLESPYSHECIPLPGKDAVWPIDFGTCDPSIYNHTNISMEQFNQIFGLGASQRGGAAPKRTATAEIIQDKSLNARQQDKLKVIKEFFSVVANGIKNTVDDTLTLQREVEILGPSEQPYIVQYIPGVDTHGDFDCEIDLAELAMPNMEMERNQWIGLLDIAGRSPLVFSNPVICKETLRRFGIDNKELVRAFVEIATRNMQMQAAGAGGGGKTGGSKGLPQGGLGQMMGAAIAGGINGGG